MIEPARTPEMNAVVLHETGGPDVLRLERVPVPTPGSTEVLVRLSHAALNHLDIWIRKGMPRVAMPRIMGADGAGEVVAAGELAPAELIGTRVLLDPSVTCGTCPACLAGDTVFCDHFSVLGEHRAGTHAQYVVVPAVNVHRIPQHLSNAEAAALPLAFATAWRMVMSRAQACPGETMLVWGATAGVGCAALQIARHLGVRTIATSRNDDKLAELTALGADFVVNSSNHDVVDHVREIVGEGGIDVVFDHLGEVSWKPSMALLRKGGRFVTCGATTGANPPAGVPRMFWKGLTVMGSTMATKQDFAQMLRFVDRHQITPRVDASFPMTEIRDAHERMESARHVGKIVIDVS